jgi:uncharacterized protein (DUF1778 family)
MIEKRDSMIGVRVTKSERLILVSKAAAANKRLSDYLRVSALNAAPAKKGSKHVGK